MTQELSPHEFLTPEEAGELARLSPRTLENHRLNRTGPRYYRIGPGRIARILYHRRDLLAWMETYAEE